MVDVMKCGIASSDNYTGQPTDALSCRLIDTFQVTLRNAYNGLLLYQ